ncbi:MAG TPA: ABC transporter substrate-binding protein [Polyangia bacterium]
MAFLVGFTVLTAATGCRKKPVPATGTRLPVATSRDAGLNADDPQPVPLSSCLPSAPLSGEGGTGILRVRLAAEPPHLDPTDEVSDVSALVLRGLVHEPLLTCLPNSDGATPIVQPSSGPIAGWELTPGADGFTLRLRAGGIFHDGRAITGADVRASIESVWKGGARLPHARAALVDVAGVEAPTHDLVRVRLKRPSPITLRALCEVPLVSAAALYAPRRRDPAAASTGPIGSGPFRFAGWARGKSIRLVRFAQPGRPLASLSEILFLIEPDPGRALGQLRQGELDLIPQLDAVHFPEQVRPAALGDSSRLLLLRGQRHSFLAINHHRVPLDQLKFRRALSLLWDRVALADELHRGLAQPIGAPPFATIDPPKLDVAQATQLLREVGTLPAELTKRAPPIGARLSLLHSGSRTARAELRRYAERLRRLGVFIELSPLDHAALVERLTTGQFDLALVAWQGSPTEDPRARFGSNGAFNYGKFQSPAVDVLLDELRTGDGPLSRTGLDQRLGQRLAEELPAVFLYRHNELAVASKRVAGLCNQDGQVSLSNARMVP